MKHYQIVENDITFGARNKDEEDILSYKKPFFQNWVSNKTTKTLLSTLMIDIWEMKWNENLDFIFGNIDQV